MRQQHRPSSNIHCTLQAGGISPWWGHPVLQPWTMTAGQQQCTGDERKLSAMQLWTPASASFYLLHPQTRVLRDVGRMWTCVRVPHSTAGVAEWHLTSCCDVPMKEKHSGRNSMHAPAALASCMIGISMQQQIAGK